MSVPRSCASLLILTLGWLTAILASAQAPDPAISGSELDRTHGLKVSAQLLPATGDQPPRLAITAEIPDGWHIYSTTQKPGGPKRTSILLPESMQFKLAGAWTASPSPTVEREKYNDVWPNLAIEEHTGRVTWTAPLELAAGVDVSALTIQGQLKAFMCSDDVCVTVTLPFTAKTAAAQPGGMALIWTQLVLAAPTVPAAAGSGGVPAPVDQVPAQPPPPIPTQPVFSTSYIKISGGLDHVAIAPGSTATLSFMLAPAPGSHTYPMPEVAVNSEARPTLVAVTDRAGLDVGPATASGMLVTKEANGEMERQYQGPVTVKLPIHVPADASLGTHTIYGQIGYQTCLDKGTCIPPAGARFSVPVTVAAANQTGATPAQFVRHTYGAAALAAGWKKPTKADTVPTAAPTAAAPTGAAPVPDSTAMIPVAPYGGGAMYGLGLNLLLAFLGGLLLNAMPCVLPVIGLKVMSFVQQAGHDRRAAFTLNLWFSLGVMVVFLAWASLIAFFSQSASAQFQTPQFTISLVVITFAFALSLFGVWEIPIPGFVGSSSAHSVGEREGATGAVAKGILSTILATPCVGPLIGGTVNWAIGSGSPARIFAIYGAMGIGMASPYLVLGANPALLRWLPKPGLWMETFKQLMGFMLLATVLWLFSSLPSQYFVSTLALVFSVWMACWWIGRTPLTAEFGRKLRAWTVGAVIVAGVTWLAFGGMKGVPTAKAANVAPGAEADWRPFTPAALQQLRAEGKTVLIDFTADWCFTCKLNKPWALHSKGTEEYMRQHGIVGLVADKTEDAPDIDSLMTRLDHASGMIPFYAVFPGNGGPVITYNQGPLWEGLLLDMLRRAGPSRSASRPIETAHR